MALDIEYVKERHAGKWLALVVIILVLAAAGWLAYKWYTTGDLPVSLPVASANSAVDESDVTYDQVNEYTVPAANPRYISIPSINLNSTRIYPVGIDSNNLLEVTANINDVAWYEKSGTPGDGGVILMNGHNTGINNDGAFAKLSELVKGDRINIERGDGRKFSYTVVENQSMSIDEVNATGMKTMGTSADPSKEGLNLIAFDGKWVPRLNMFDRRVMLRAVIVNDN
jgi:hypothetical protein